MKIIDVQTKGNVFRLYLGADNCEPWGDDWDDAPFECNAGPVYEEYVRAYVDYAVDLDYAVYQPCDDDSHNCWSKEDMLKQRVAALAVLHTSGLEDAWSYDNFNTIVSDRNAHLIYLNDIYDEKDFEWATKLMTYEKSSTTQPTI